MKPEVIAVLELVFCIAVIAWLFTIHFLLGIAGILVVVIYFFRDSNY